MLFSVEIEAEMATSLLQFSRANLNHLFAAVIALETEGKEKKNKKENDMLNKFTILIFYLEEDPFLISSHLRGQA